MIGRKRSRQASRIASRSAVARPRLRCASIAKIDQHDAVLFDDPDHIRGV